MFDVPAGGVIMMGYVKMCRVAEEIQAGWKPKSGDLYHYNCAINPLRPLVVSPDVHGFRMEWSDEFFKNCFWLPRQEDLQQIFRLKNGNPDDYWILKSFLVWFSDLNFCHYRDVSINKLWLRYVMETIYNKRWNGTEWEVL